MPTVRIPTPLRKLTNGQEEVAAAGATIGEILAGMRLLAETEGIFTETAGGVTVGATRRLIAEGRIGSDDSVVLCITGQGLKTTDPLVPTLAPPPLIGARLAELDSLLQPLNQTKRE